jgi:hypothetical protein
MNSDALWNLRITLEAEAINANITLITGIFSLRPSILPSPCYLSKRKSAVLEIKSSILEKTIFPA